MISKSVCLSFLMLKLSLFTAHNLKEGSKEWIPKQSLQMLKQVVVVGKVMENLQRKDQGWICHHCRPASTLTKQWCLSFYKRSRSSTKKAFAGFTHSRIPDRQIPSRQIIFKFPATCESLLLWQPALPPLSVIECDWSGRGSG
ncbi:uncharacterized protein [Cherax quadricarinatus]|uniref:uncharacterized protein isoform X2 n=1 Tax=Cherax quadricarinatus TaxID=27406 RepID=UPI0023785CB3|nr:uncharacterized protein LOC128701135 isoform X1 [Cherax quadricarinatus]